MQKLQKYHWQTSPTTSGLFTSQVKPKNNFKQLYFNGLMSTFFNKMWFYQKNKQQNGDCYDHEPASSRKLGAVSI